jgi:alpha-tubulin suppressor-like RCC1 family protein
MGASRRARRLVLGVAVLAAVVAPGPATGATASRRSHPEPGTADWSTVSIGGRHSCGIRTTGRLYCWGDDEFGELGDDAALADQATPVEVAGGATNWASVSAGAEHTCARRTTGRLFCWGSDADGRLGDDAAIADHATPVQVAGAATNWASVSLGGNHTCARKTNHRLFCWGDDSNGQLGNNANPADRHVPTQVSGATTDWASVSTLAYHTCALKTTGHLFCWGNDGNGQLGDGLPLVGVGTPVEVSGAAADWASVSVGGFHTCARKTNDRVYCWGYDADGQLGDDVPLTDQSTPVEIAA